MNQQKNQPDKINLLHQSDIQSEAPKKTSLPKWSMIVVIAAGIIAIGIVSYFCYQNYFVSEEPVACAMDAKLCPDGSSVGRIPPSCEFAQCPEITDPTVSWQTYTNEEYGFEIKYPKDWKVKYRVLTSKSHLDLLWLQSDEYFVGPYRRQDSLNIDIYDFSLFSYKSFDQYIESVVKFPSGAADPATVKKQDILVDNQPGVKLSYTEAGDADSGFWEAKDIHILKDGLLLYIVNCIFEKCDQILSTFKFID